MHLHGYARIRASKQKSIHAGGSLAIARTHVCTCAINVTRIHKTGVRWIPACKDGNGCPRRKYAQDGAKSVSRQELSRKTTCMSLYSPV